MQIHSLPAGGAFGAAEKCCFITHNRQDEMKMTKKKKKNTVGFLQRYSDIKTHASRFDFETCSVHVYSTKSKPFRKSFF